MFHCSTNKRFFHGYSEKYRTSLILGNISLMIVEFYVNNQFCNKSDLNDLSVTSGYTQDCLLTFDDINVERYLMSLNKKEVIAHKCILHESKLNTFFS